MERYDECQRAFLELVFYPTKRTKRKFESEIYEKLYPLLPKNKIFAYENLIDEVRTKNYWDCIQVISQFMKDNPSYMKSMKKVYLEEPPLTVIQMVLMNYVYVCGNSIDVYRNMNFTSIPECILYGDDKQFTLNC